MHVTGSVHPRSQHICGAYIGGLLIVKGGVEDRKQALGTLFKHKLHRDSILVDLLVLCEGYGQEEHGLTIDLQVLAFIFVLVSVRRNGAR